MELIEKIQTCKVVAQAIMSDSRITDSEYEFINKLMEKYELSESQRKDILARNIDDDPGKMIKAITSSQSKDELIAELALAVAADGEISKSEKQLLTRVAEVLEMDEADIDLIVKAAL